MSDGGADDLLYGLYYAPGWLKDDVCARILRGVFARKGLRSEQDLGTGDLDDLARELQIRFWNFSRKETPRNPLAVACKFAANLVDEALRTPRCRDRREFDDAVIVYADRNRQADPPDEQAEREEWERTLLEGLFSHLGEKDRRVLDYWLSDASGKTTREAAATLGMSANALYQSTFRIRQEARIESGRPFHTLLGTMWQSPSQSIADLLISHAENRQQFLLAEAAVAIFLGARLFASVRHPASPRRPPTEFDSYSRRTLADRIGETWYRCTTSLRDIRDAAESTGQGEYGRGEDLFLCGFVDICYGVWQVARAVADEPPEELANVSWRRVGGVEFLDGLSFIAQSSYPYRATRRHFYDLFLREFQGCVPSLSPEELERFSRPGRR